MKIDDLTYKQLAILAKIQPDWMAENRPESMVYHRPGWMAIIMPETMAKYRPGWMAENEPGRMCEYRPEWMIENNPEMMVKYRPYWRQAENRQAEMAIPRSKIIEVGRMLMSIELCDDDERSRNIEVPDEWLHWLDDT
jgi:hypothetical protein